MRDASLPEGETELLGVKYARRAAVGIPSLRGFPQNARYAPKFPKKRGWAFGCGTYRASHVVRDVGSGVDALPLEAVEAKPR